MIPHSYLVHFEFVQTCCLSSYAMHIPYFDHSRTWHQTLSVGHDNHTKPRHPPETKKKSRKWVIMLMVPRPKKIKEGKRGRWQGQKYEWWTSVFAYTCTWSKYLNCISTWRHIVWICKINEKDEHIPLLPYIDKREVLPWENHTPWVPEWIEHSRVCLLFKSLKILQAPRRKARVDSWWHVMRINRWRRRC